MFRGFSIMRVKLFSLFAALLLVAACAGQQTETASTGAGEASAAGGPSPGTEEDFVVNVGDRVFFGFDRFDLTPEARATLDDQAAWLQEYPNVRIVIEGHADERGTREYNLALGERRANSVRNYLVAAGIDASRITTISYGKERPAVLGSNEQAWAQNRRGVTVIQ
jgi:peptidoglycan-associated lipoprotein